MPKTEVVFYKEDDVAPVLEWLKEFRYGNKAQQAVYAKFSVRIDRLCELGNQLHRPEADYLRNDIYELRVGREGINYRILYFFHQGVGAILVHSIIKESAVPNKDIDLAILRKDKFRADPERHTYEED